MNEVDRRNKLDEEPFSYRISKDNKVFISWNGKEVKILRGKESERFLSRVKNAEVKEIQLVMAKVTGNFKRGNEKNSRK